MNSRILDAHSNGLLGQMEVDEKRDVGMQRGVRWALGKNFAKHLSAKSGVKLHVLFSVVHTLHLMKFNYIQLLLLKRVKTSSVLKMCYAAGKLSWSGRHW